MLIQLWQLMRSMREESLPCVEKFGLSGFDPWVLGEIERLHYPGEIVRATQIPAPTVSQTLKRLEAEGFIVRSLEPSDLRKMRFEVTEKGRQVMQVSKKCMVQALEHRLERLSPAQQQSFMEILRTLGAESAVERK